MLRAPGQQLFFCLRESNFLFTLEMRAQLEALFPIPRAAHSSSNKFKFYSNMWLKWIINGNISLLVESVSQFQGFPQKKHRQELLKNCVGAPWVRARDWFSSACLCQFIELLLSDNLHRNFPSQIHQRQLSHFIIQRSRLAFPRKIGAFQNDEVAGRKNNWMILNKGFTSSSFLISSVEKDWERRDKKKSDECK